MDFVQLDVFADAPYKGNPLAVFPDAASLSSKQMGAIAREMNLSETTFVSDCNAESYTVRIFTPEEELDFAGHPTIGTAWALRRLGRLTAEEMTQHSRVGATPVTVEGDKLYFERPGRAEPDVELADERFVDRLAKGLGLGRSEIGQDARELGRSGSLRPAYSDAGLRHLIVPLRSLAALGTSRPIPGEVPDTAPGGIYCFTAVAAGRVQARGFFPGHGVAEDPGTGSAAADLGIYLADRIGSIRFDIDQGVEMKRPSRISVDAKREVVRVGGACHLVFEGTLSALP